MTAKQRDKVWLITGCSTGLGRALAKVALVQGYRVAVTARKPDSVRDIAKGFGKRAITLQLDVTNRDEAEGAVAETEKVFGKIDVLVNNAGVGYFGAIEESEEIEVRRMFEINVFGLARMTHLVLPGMRARRSGHIINVASIGGLRASPAIGYYNATKFAVVGFSEALALETAPLGIHVTVVEPSGFRTDWAGRSAKESPKHIPDYEETAGANRKTLRESSGRQRGDPVRAAEAMIKAVESDNPPLHLLLGKAALKGANLKMQMLREQIDASAETAIGADFPEGQ